MASIECKPAQKSLKSVDSAQQPNLLTLYQTFSFFLLFLSLSGDNIWISELVVGRRRQWHDHARRSPDWRPLPSMPKFERDDSYQCQGAQREYREKGVHPHEEHNTFAICIAAITVLLLPARPYIHFAARTVEVCTIITPSKAMLDPLTALGTARSPWEPRSPPSFAWITGYCGLIFHVARPAGLWTSPAGSQCLFISFAAHFCPKHWTKNTTECCPWYNFAFTVS